MRRCLAGLWLTVLAGLLWPLLIGHHDGATLPAAGKVSGTFPAGGPLPLGRTGPASGRYWCSWGGNDANEGELTLGPFPAPRTLGLPVSGYPGMPGNELFLENQRTGERMELTRTNIGERWSEIRVDPPSRWRGDPVAIHALDHAVGWGGWFAVGEPRAVPLLFRGSIEFSKKLATLLATGTALALLAAGAGRTLALRVWAPPPLVPVLALAAVSGFGYAAFWIFLAAPGWGRSFTAAAWAAAAVAVLRPWPPLARRGNLVPDYWIPAALTLAVGLGYLAVLLPDSSPPLGALGQRRFGRPLPGDNLIPQIFAARLERGQSPRHLMGDWLSSDRPPLQTGVILLVEPPLSALGADPDEVDQCVGIWLQLIWIPALWSWLRLAQTSVAASAFVMAALAPTGVLIVNTLFVWPKLFAAGLFVGAYGLWFGEPPEAAGRTARYLAGGLLAGLAYLAHGGVAFSLVALLPLALWPPRRIEWARWSGAAGLFILLLLPWLAYQHYYEPPGNRLFKWHLAGVVDPDDRGLLTTLVESYRAETWANLWQNRMANLQSVSNGPWRQLLMFDFSDLPNRRIAEFFDPLFTLGWWGGGIAVALIAAAWGARTAASVRLAQRFVPLVRATGWCALTLVVWIAVMFTPHSTVIHQGSYVSLLLLLGVGALGLWRLHPLAFVAAALVQGYASYRIWLPLPTPDAGAAPAEAMNEAKALGFLALVALAAIIATAARQKTAVVGDRPGCSGSPDFPVSDQAARSRRCQAATICRMVSSSDWVISHAG